MQEKVFCPEKKLILVKKTDIFVKAMHSKVTCLCLVFLRCAINGTSYLNVTGHLIVIGHLNVTAHLIVTGHLNETGHLNVTGILM